MSDEVRIVDVDSDSLFERYIAVESEAFGESAAEQLAETSAGRAYTMSRVAMVDDELVGGYGLIPVGQYFGGRSVPAQAVASVFVHPAWRRRGVAGRLLGDLVAAARAMPAALAPLYASTTRLYRRHGWEVGDRTLWCSVQASALARLNGEGRARANPDRAAVEAMRRAFLPRFDGAFDRPDWWLPVQWDTFGKPDARREYGWYEGDVLTGHVTFVLAMSETDRDTSLRVQDLEATTGDALRGLLGLLGGYESVAGTVSIKRSDALMRELALLLPDADKIVDVSGAICWMQRIIDLELAVAQRGWPQGTSAQLHLEVIDPADAQPRRVVLEVSGAAAALTPGGEGRIRLGVGALSAWYSSRLPGWQALRLGLLEAPPADIEVMDSLVGLLPRLEPDYF